MAKKHLTQGEDMAIPIESLVRYIDTQDRQYEFFQDNNNNVSAKVYYGLNEHGLNIINTVSQANILIEKNTSSLNQSPSVSMAKMTSQERKNAFQTFRKAIQENQISDKEFQTTNGRKTDLKNRATGAVFHEVDSITLVL